MAGAMIEAARDADRFSGEDNSDDETNDLDEFEEESSISSLPSDDDDEQRIDDQQNRASNSSKSDNVSIENIAHESKQVVAGGVYRMKPLPRLEGEKPYQCDICKNSFQQKKSVYRHIKEVHKMTLIFVDDNGNESPTKSSVSFQCEISGCDLSYPNRKLLTKHVREHMNKRGSDSDSESKRPAKRIAKSNPGRTNGIQRKSNEQFPLKSELL